MTAAENTEKTPMDGAPEIDFDRFRPTRSAIQRRNIMDHFMWVLIAVAFVIACIPLISLLWTTIVNGIKRLILNLYVILKRIFYHINILPTSMI